MEYKVYGVLIMVENVKGTEDFKNALFINYGGLGDEILFLPCIEDFKKKYPNCKITLCLESRAKGVKQLTSLIDEIIEVDIKASGLKKYFNVLGLIQRARKGKFDVVISSGKSPLVAIILYLTGIKRRSGYFSKTAFLLTDGVELDENQYAGSMYHDLILPYLDDNILDEISVPHLKADGNFILPHELQSGQGNIQGEASEGGFIALHPGVSKMSIDKQIYKCPDVSFWHSVIKGVLEKGKRLVLFGGPDDKEIIEKILEDKEVSNHPNFINYFGKTKNLADLMNTLSFADTLICADSAPLHIGVGLGLNIVAIFGPTNEDKLVPKKDNIKVITNKKIDCRPCLWHKRKVNCNQSQCLNIDVSDVLNTLSAL